MSSSRDVMRLGKTFDERLLAQKKVVDVQTAPLDKYKADANRNPKKVFCLNKDTVFMYDFGLDGVLPRDTTVLWPNDGFGYLRRLGIPGQDERPGGVYWMPPSLKQDLVARWTDLLKEDRELQLPLTQPQRDRYFRLCGHMIRYLCETGLYFAQWENYKPENEEEARVAASNYIERINARWNRLDGGRWSGFFPNPALEEASVTNGPNVRSVMMWPGRESDSERRRCSRSTWKRGGRTIRGSSCSSCRTTSSIPALYRSAHAREANDLLAQPRPRTWSDTVPANLVVREILGVSELEPGAAKVRIAPQPGKLRWMKGSVPTVKGPVRLDLRFEGRSLSGTIETSVPAVFLWNGKTEMLEIGPHEVTR